MLEAFSSPSWRVCDEIREEIKLDLRYKEVMEKLEMSDKGVENYEMRDVASNIYEETSCAKYGRS